MTELVRVQRAPLPQKIEYARELAESGLLPSQYRKAPGNVLYAIEYGEALGISPMAAITGVHVIEGKPSASAGLISGLVRRAGHRLRVTGDDTQAVAEIVRSDDPDFTFRSTWTMDRARQAGVTGKKVWQQYPAAMLKARAITEVARDACEEVLLGLHYTAEELGAAEVDAEGVPVSLARDWVAEARQAADADAVRRIWKSAQADGVSAAELGQIVEIGRQKAEAEKAAQPTAGQPGPEATEADDDGIVDAEVVEDGTDLAPLGRTPASTSGGGTEAGSAEGSASALPARDGERVTAPQMRMMFALLTKCGLGRDEDRAERLRVSSIIVGRQLGSANEMTTGEAKTLLDTLTYAAEQDDPAGALAETVCGIDQHGDAA